MLGRLGLPYTLGILWILDKFYVPSIDKRVGQRDCLFGDIHIRDIDITVLRAKIEGFFLIIIKIFP
jgi:hypothetical protein